MVRNETYFEVQLSAPGVTRTARCGGFRDSTELPESCVDETPTARRRRVTGSSSRRVVLDGKTRVRSRSRASRSASPMGCRTFRLRPPYRSWSGVLRSRGLKRGVARSPASGRACSSSSGAWVGEDREWRTASNAAAADLSHDTRSRRQIMYVYNAGPRSRARDHAFGTA